MAVLTRSGRVAIAKALSIQPMHLAWGTGDGAWTIPPPEDEEAVALMAEVGRRKAQEVGFATPDPDGDIVMPDGRFSRIATPTNHLLVVFKYDFTDGPTEVIREIGVFVDTKTDPGLPPGQMYFLPADVTDPGLLLHLENRAPIFRSPATRESFEIVITF